MRPSWSSADIAGSRSSKSSSTAGATLSRAEACRSSGVSPGRPSTSAAMRSKIREWRTSSRRWREKHQATRVSSEAIEVFWAAAPNGVRCSATASSATRKPHRSAVSRCRRSSGSSGHARASAPRSIAVGSHCRRPAFRAKKLGQKLRSEASASPRCRARRSAMAGRYQPPRGPNHVLGVDFAAPVRLMGDHPRQGGRHEVHAADPPGHRPAPRATPRPGPRSRPRTSRAPSTPTTRRSTRRRASRPGLQLRRARDGDDRARAGRRDADHRRPVRRD